MRDILVVDDDIAAAEYASLVLEQAEYRTRRAADAFEALRAIEQEVPALVISDLQMPGISGIDLLERIRERWPSIPVMLVTVAQDVSTVVDAVQRGAVNYLVKPVSPAVLLAATVKALARDHEVLGQKPERVTRDIVGSSQRVVEVRRLIVLAARSDVNVLVVGETGTGKELVARAIHRLSDKGSSPFVAHNCATTQAEVFDAEFFGHTRGSFTGAHRDRPGLLRDAHGGTLLLDELECLSLANQAKLLRVIDDGEMRAVGSNKVVSVSVRFVGATNRSPLEMMASRELREDLYYRLRGFEIQLPPLRERLDDMVPLCEHFLRGTGKSLTTAAIAALQHHPWPGNVRQLRTVLACAVIRSASAVVNVDDLNLKTPSGLSVPSMCPENAWSLGQATNLDPSLRVVEQQAIIQALEQHGGNRSEAARSLGIHRSTLQRRLRELNVASQHDKKRK